MIECSSHGCQTRIYGGSLGIKADGSSRRNTKCGRCVRLAKEAAKQKARECQVKGCKTIISKCDGRKMKRCAKCSRTNKQKKNVDGRKNRTKGVFIRDSKNGKTKYKRIGEVDKLGTITLFKGVVE